MKNKKFTKAEVDEIKSRYEADLDSVDLDEVEALYLNNRICYQDYLHFEKQCFEGG